MPQQSLLTDHPPMTALVVTIKSWPHTPDPSTVSVAVAVAVGTDDPKTRWSAALDGSGADFLNTLVEAVTSAYMYEESPRDVAHAAARVHKAARRHQRTSDY